MPTSCAQPAPPSLETNLRSMVRHDMGGPIPENLDLPAYCTLRGIALQLIRMKVKAVTMIDSDTQALPVVAHQVAKGSRFSFVLFQGLFCLTMDSRNVHGIHVRTTDLHWSDEVTGKEIIDILSWQRIPVFWMKIGHGFLWVAHACRLFRRSRGVDGSILLSCPRRQGNDRPVTATQAPGVGSMNVSLKLAQHQMNDAYGNRQNNPGLGDGTELGRGGRSIENEVSRQRDAEQKDTPKMAQQCSHDDTASCSSPKDQEVTSFETQVPQS
ncbi:MAG: hypothetical protein BYD32DRAFT_490833 [Podila humilis]|nr:MAG: hypothetical protein BYD32DRAFT_490833 [Podila humilis]